MGGGRKLFVAGVIMGVEALTQERQAPVLGSAGSCCFASTQEEHCSLSPEAAAADLPTESQFAWEPGSTLVARGLCDNGHVRNSLHPHRFKCRKEGGLPCQLPAVGPRRCVLPLLAPQPLGLSCTPLYR